MALKLVRKKKATPVRLKKSEITKFMDAVDVQLRLAAGEKVKSGRGTAKSFNVGVNCCRNGHGLGIFDSSGALAQQKLAQVCSSDFCSLYKLCWCGFFLSDPFPT